MTQQSRTSLFKAPIKTTVERTPTTNFPICVVRYDIKAVPPCVHGYRLDDGLDVKISLRNFEGLNPSGSAFKRPEILDFASPRKFRDDPGILAGGMMYVQDAVKIADDEFAARWISVLSHDSVEAEVIMCTAHYEAPRKGKDKVVDGKTVSGSPYSRATILFDFPADNLTEELRDRIGYTAPFKVGSVDELKKELLMLLAKNRNVGAGIRLCVDGNYDALYLNRGVENIPLETLVDDFIATKLPDDIGDILAQNGSLLEVIPYCSIFMGTRSASDDFKRLEAEKVAAGAEGKPTGKISIKSGRYSHTTTSEDGRDRNEQLFGETVMAIRMMPANEKGEAAIFFTAMEPVFPRGNTLRGLRDAIAYAQTKLFKPSIQYYPGNAPKESETLNQDAEQKQEAQAPVAQAPVAQAPVAQAPVAQAPVAQAPEAQAPEAQAPVAQAPVAQQPAAVDYVEYTETVKSSASEMAPNELVDQIAEQAPDRARRFRRA